MIEAGLIDSSFSREQRSVSLAGDNIGETPQNLVWKRDEYLPVTFFTDKHLNEVIRTPERQHLTKVAWLVEPPSLSDKHYRTAWELRHHFDWILTYDTEYLEQGGEKWLYYPLGGSWIKPQRFGVHDKTRMVSLIATDKRRARGHILRHKAAKLAELFDIDVMGRGYRPIESKSEGLSRYRYSIVIESCRRADYLSEKLVDCLSQGTVPIYWGTPDVYDHFDMGGIIPFKDIDDLVRILVNIVSNWDYLNRISSINKNLELAWKYRCSEDWITERYPYIFNHEQNATAKG